MITIFKIKLPKMYFRKNWVEIYIFQHKLLCIFLACFIIIKTRYGAINVVNTPWKSGTISFDYRLMMYLVSGDVSSTHWKLWSVVIVILIILLFPSFIQYLSQLCITLTKLKTLLRLLLSRNHDWRENYSLKDDIIRKEK